MSQNEQMSPVIFDGNAGIITDGNKKIEINRQGCRCLELLLSRPDAVVSKEELIAQCWGKYGTIVSDNTVRQTFFQLRKILSELNLPTDTLNTVPRQGYKLKSGLIIAGAIGRDNKIDDQEDDSRIFSSSDREAVSVSESLSSSNEFFAPDRKRWNPTASRVFNTWTILLSGFFIFSAVCVIRYFMLVTPLSYKEVRRDGGFIYFIQDGFKADDDMLITRAAHLFVQPYFRHTQGKYVYINRSEQQNLSLFVCDGPIEDKKNICTPVTALGDE